MEYINLTIKQAIEKGNPKRPFVGAILKTKAKTLRGYRDAMCREHFFCNWDLDDFEDDFNRWLKKKEMYLCKDGVVFWITAEDYKWYVKVDFNGDYSKEYYCEYNYRLVGKYIK